MAVTPATRISAQLHGSQKPARCLSQTRSPARSLASASLTCSRVQTAPAFAPADILQSCQSTPAQNESLAASCLASPRHRSRFGSPALGSTSLVLQCSYPIVVLASQKPLQRERDVLPTPVNIPLSRAEGTLLPGVVSREKGQLRFSRSSI